MTATGTGATPARPILDLFEDHARPGRLRHGRRAADARGIVDVEGVIGVDGGALRIQTPAEPGWRRAGVFYGPFDHRHPHGVVMAALVLNGHNTSQAGHLTQHFVRRIGRWAIGSGSARLSSRFAGWLRHRRKRILFGHLRRWWRTHVEHAGGSGRVLDENLAVGWFAEEAPSDPVSEGHAFVMHAADTENGELWIRYGDAAVPVLRGVQNIPLYYVVIARPSGVVYLAGAGMDNAAGLPRYPLLRPLLVDPKPLDGAVHAGIHQSVLGQIGFRVDTRVHGVQIGAADRWPGRLSASMAGAVTGEGEALAAEGDGWRIVSGELVRSPGGLVAPTGGGRAELGSSEPAGVLHAVFRCGEGGDGAVEIRFRVADAERYCAVTATGSRCALVHCTGGVPTELASAHIHLGEEVSIQISDDGSQIGVLVDGKPTFAVPVQNAELPEGTGVEIGLSGPVTVRDFKILKRSVDASGLLELPHLPVPAGTRVLISDDFEGAEGSVEGRRTTDGNAEWSRRIGSGTIVLTGDGAARVVADAGSPNPGRTAYMVDWPDPGLADIEVEITPPGDRRGDGHSGRGGVIFWQDPANYIMINNWLDDAYGGASISSFFMLDGFEDIYDAVWTNVGGRIVWGKPYRLRAAFDGSTFAVHVDGEPVLYRSLRDVYPEARRLRINRIGLLANWEWGNDTGSRFRRFVARSGE